MSEFLQGVNGIDLPFVTGKFQPATACLPLITIFQYMEQITDGQANEAIRLRLDWRYALHLPQYNRGAEMSVSVYCQYRQRVLDDPILQNEIQLVYQRLDAFGLWKDCLFGHPDVPTMLANVCTINRVALAQQALAQAIESLAVWNPEWLRSIILPRWYNAYLYAEQAPSSPKSCRTARPYEQPGETEFIGADLVYLLQTCREKGPSGYETLPEIIQLQSVLHEQYELCQDAGSGVSHTARWRQRACSYCPSQGSQPC